MTDLFKDPVSLDTLYTFLDKICLKTHKYYVLDVNAFRCLQYHREWYDEFMKSIRAHYHVSKQWYTERDITYNHLVTVIRQICKGHDVRMDRKTAYSKHDYNNDYYIAWN